MSAPSSPAALASPRAWVGVVSRAHVLRGVEGSFAQLCHGKQGPLSRMSVGDWLVYYSPTTEFGGGSPLRAFTALGRVAGERTYPFDMGGGFVPHRRAVAYAPARREASVKALGARLHFVRDNPSWGMLARRGHFEIDLHDVAVIAEALGVEAWVGSAGRAGGGLPGHDRRVSAPSAGPAVR